MKRVRTTVYTSEHGNIFVRDDGGTPQATLEMYLPGKKKRHIRYGPEYVPEGHPFEKWRWVENLSDGLRVMGPVHEINVPGQDQSAIRHTGWFTSDEGYLDELCYGVVVRLPARDGVSRFVPGFRMPYEDNDCAVLDFHSVTEDLRQACRNADTMAEWVAEEAREDSRKYRLELDIAESQQRLLELRRQIRAEAVTLRGFRKWIGYAQNLFGEGPPIGMRIGVTRTLEDNIRRLRREMYAEGRKIRKCRSEL